MSEDEFAYAAILTRYERALLRRTITKAPQAPTRTADPRPLPVSLAIRSPVSTAPAETVLQRSVAP